jgi:hypothetical protein
MTSTSQIAAKHLIAEEIIEAVCHTNQLYSPDVASSDFYLFLLVKEKRERTHVAVEDQFFESLQAIVRRIDREELNRVFQDSVRRVQKEVTAMETTLSDKPFLSLKVLRTFIRRG